MPVPIPRYIGNDPQTKPFAGAVRAQVHDHFQRQGLSWKAGDQAVTKTVVMLTLFLAPLVVLLVTAPPVWMAILLYFAMGVGMAGVGMGVMHDALHGATSNHKWVNDLLGGTMYLLGSDAYTWKLQHNGAHHTHTNVDEVDQDIDPPDLLRFSEHAPLWKVHKLQHVYAFFFYGLLTLVKLGNDFFSLEKARRNHDPRKGAYNYPMAFVAMVGVKVAHVVMFIGLPLWLTPLLWWQVLLGFVLMHFTCGVILGTVFQLAHVVEGTAQPLPDANGIIPTEWAVHELLTTADFAPDHRFITWYTGGLNYQIEHHLFPYISHVHYPAIAPIVQRVAAEYGLPYNVKPTTRNAIRSHVRRLHDLGHGVQG
ncbi:MAG: acyl-CoA desaturase [Flavobacteriales bacterium]|jgi:linoleoyl-CoA desaturase|nr:acyl-CoA desaturase [Flavobacteriales bacterium]